jgi:sortase (surface protein transpeptidase)
VIEDIGMDRSLVSVGLDKNRVPIVPKHDVGWYNLSAMPGQGENVVLWGHVLRFKSAPKIPAPFARLKELQPGARVVLYDEVGNAHAYVVTRQVWATPDQVEYILPVGKERITMVSCIGDKVIANGDVEMTHRLITIAEPQS